MIGYLLMFGGLAVVTAMLIRVRHMEEEENTSSVADGDAPRSRASSLPALATNAPPAHLLDASRPSRGSLEKEES